MKRRCGKCISCLAPDCRKCEECTRKKIYGGDGSSHKTCLVRGRCLYVLGLSKQQQQEEEEEQQEVVVVVNRDEESDEKDVDTGDDDSPRTLSKRDQRAQRRQSLGVLSPPSITSSSPSDVKSRKRSSSSSSVAAALPSSKKPRTQAPVNPDKMDSDKPTSSTSTKKRSAARTSPSAAAKAIHPKKQAKIAKATSLGLYGQPQPSPPQVDICSGCLGARDDELDDSPVLLCDGPGCGREYHLPCCQPSVSQVPEGSWYCQDCSLTGSTSLLVDYLEANDSARSDFLHDNATKNDEDYVTLLLLQDIKESAERSSSPSSSSKTAATSQRIPISELVDSAEKHRLALAQLDDLPRRSRKSNASTTDTDASTVVSKDCLTPQEHVGLPLRLYCPAGNQYHTGRIVDYRKSASAKCNGVEFMVRFLAGQDDRKTSHSHWIRLEEHALAVGTSLVWADKVEGEGWSPSILWLRTSRELVSATHLLRESEGQVRYRASGKEEDEVDEPPTKSTFKGKHKVWALARSFITDCYRLVNVKSETVDLQNQVLVGKYRVNKKTMFQHSVALAERAERESVRQWQSLQQEDKMGCWALSASHELNLERLFPLNSSTSPESSSRVKLCHNVSRGVSRMKILEMLERRGITTTKDIGATLRIEIHERPRVDLCKQAMTKVNLARGEEDDLFV